MELQVKTISSYSLKAPSPPACFFLPLFVLPNFSAQTKSIPTKTARQFFVLWKNMPQELPGFYYDKEKNRYFPLKGPIPGSSRSSSSSNNAKKPSTNNTQESNFCRRTGVRISQLLQGRELNGNVITSSKGKCDFMEEFLKIQASQPVVWKYRSTEKIADSAMDQIHIDIHTAEGQTEANVLITGGVNGSLSLFEVGKVGEHNHGVECIPDRMWPVVEEKRAECGKDPGCIWRPPGASLHMSSNISCIKMCGKHSPIQQALRFDLFVCLGCCQPYIMDSFTSLKVFISCPGNLSVMRYRDLAGITTLGSETSGGSVYILNLVEPVDFDSSSALGTNVGAALVNLETGMTSWVCRSKSDVLSQQLDPSGNIVLCGLRNGAILTVDVREKQERVSDRFIRHRIPYSSLGRQGPSSSKQWFEVKGNIYPSRTILMPSSVCSLVSLQSYDQYFLASSMDGLVSID
ncbi:hypothetical protein POTOM_004141 [Populus tomentosa]|uniref:Transducin/WD40 repeat-like superfamily protein n=1 Tax=Populus tomentosa TaxID=118781 RepID=A0A8X8APY0_POPTO|nr:hypothetical protein POTOM_004141 [Populus tomentosa]